MGNRILRLAFVEKHHSEEFKRHYPQSLVEFLAFEILEKRIEEFDVIFLSENMVDGILAAMGRAKRRPTLVVTCTDKEPIPKSYIEGIVDEVLVFPLRSFDALKAMRTHQNVKLLREVENINSSFPALLEKIQEDISFAQKIQRRLVNNKFPAIGPLNFSSRYWCGLEAGGEYFDVFETKDSRKVGIFFSDSSSYTLSTKVLSTLSNGARNKFESAHPDQFVPAFMEHLKGAVESQSEQFSFFYGVIDKLDLSFEFMARGAISFWVNNLELISPEIPPTLEKWNIPMKSQVNLNPGSRLMLVSDGFEGTLKKSPTRLLAGANLEKKTSNEVIHDFAFQLRRHLEREEPTPFDGEFPFPPEDCSILICDVKENALRVAR